MLTHTKVLLVEDSPMLQKINSELLRGIGCDVTLAKTGLESVNLSEICDYDLIFMDIGLPDFDGIEATKLIRRHGQNQSTPIVALTTHGKDYQQKCLDAGMSDFLSKPSPAEVLEKTIKRWTQSKKPASVA